MPKPKKAPAAGAAKPRAARAKKPAKTAAKAAPAAAAPVAKPAQPARDTVSSRAHQIWLDEGRPEGKALEHWLRAERELSGS